MCIQALFVVVRMQESVTRTLNSTWEVPTSGCPGCGAPVRVHGLSLSKPRMGLHTVLAGAGVGEVGEEKEREIFFLVSLKQL